jgi:inhibitor of cysteine peptidase
MEKLITSVILLVAAVLLVPGCLAIQSAGNASENLTAPVEIVENITVAANQTTSQAVASAPEHTDYTADVNTTTLTMKVNQTVRVSLKENPTTGFEWNTTNSTGLEVVNSNQTQDTAPEGMVGVGGVHTWILKAVEAGNQTFDAVYKRSWEPTTGKEDTYALNVTVE